MDIAEMKVGELLALCDTCKRLLGGDQLSHECSLKIGWAYLIRTVTYHYTGRIRDITATDIVLTDAAWIPDTGRFHDALRDGTLAEVEPYPSPVILSRAVIVDATEWNHPFPREQK